MSLLGVNEGHRIYESAQPHCSHREVYARKALSSSRHVSGASALRPATPSAPRPPSLHLCLLRRIFTGGWGGLGNPQTLNWAGMDTVVQAGPWVSTTQRRQEMLQWGAPPPPAASQLRPAHPPCRSSGQLAHLRRIAGMASSCWSHQGSGGFCWDGRAGG